MAINPIKSLMPTDDEGAKLGGELREKLEMQKAAGDSLKQAPTAPKRPASPVMPVDKTHSQGPYGSRPGEKPPSVVLKGIMHSGGTIPETGAYVMKKGEHVLTPDAHSKLKASMGLAHDALSHEAEEPQEPKKMIRAMHIRKAADGTHVIEHHHVHFSHPMEEHTAANTDQLHDHIEQHWGEPNTGEAESESQPDKSAGVIAMQKDLGFTK